MVRVLQQEFTKENITVYEIQAESGEYCILEKSEIIELKGILNKHFNKKEVKK